MPSTLTSSIDLAEILFTLFWLFFIALIIYLRREDKREGYPLESDRSDRAGRVAVHGFPRTPAAKTFKLPGGGEAVVPRPEPVGATLAAEPTGPFPGAPLRPTGNPMVDGVGPAAYSPRADHPDTHGDGKPLIAPMRTVGEYQVDGRDPDPRGMAVVAADGRVAGRISDLWIDRCEPQIRYMEVDLDGAGGNVLLPLYFTRIDGRRGEVRVQSLMADQFADVPRTRHPDQITLAEEDRITAYYAGGKLYAHPSRAEPLI